MATTRPAALAYLRQPTGGWLRSPAWDLTFISLSAVLVGLPFTAYQILTLAGLLAGASASVVDLVVTLLIGLTVTVGFFVPAASRLDAAFQGFNAWHSFQYLGLTWYANRLATQGNRPMSSFTRRISGPGDGWRYYGLLVLCTIGAGAIIGVLLLLRGPLGLSPEQPFYIAMLSFLLIHYYHDHVLFTDPEAIVAERATPAESRYAS